jgi:hypothetical protein
MRLVILHHVGELKTHIGVFNYPKDPEEIFPWERTNEVSEFLPNYDLIEFTTKTKGEEEISETSYSIKKIERFIWEGKYQNKTGEVETEGACTCLVFD